MRDTATKVRKEELSCGDLPVTTGRGGEPFGLAVFYLRLRSTGRGFHLIHLWVEFPTDSKISPQSY